jgi:hypothetical protein
VLRLLVCACGAFVLFRYHREIGIALENFTDNFRGGGQPPVHPLPANDSTLLRRRRQPRSR